MCGETGVLSKAIFKEILSNKWFALSLLITVCVNIVKDMYEEVRMTVKYERVCGETKNFTLRSIYVTLRESFWEHDMESDLQWKIGSNRYREMKRHLFGVSSCQWSEETPRKKKGRRGPMRVLMLFVRIPVVVRAELGELRSRSMWPQFSSKRPLPNGPIIVNVRAFRYARLARDSLFSQHPFHLRIEP